MHERAHQVVRVAKRNGKQTEQPARWANRIVGEGLEDADQLLANPANWRIHPKSQQTALEAALDGIGWIQRVIVNRTTGHVIDGHLRASLAISRGEKVPVLYVDLTEDEERLALATIDPLSAMAKADQDMLADLLNELRETPLVQDDEALRALLGQVAGENSIGYDESETPAIEQARQTLAERFIVPPFSVLDARQGYWQDRKRAWLALGIQSELGRGMVPGCGNHRSDYGGYSPNFSDVRVRGKMPADSSGHPLPLDRQHNGRSLARTFGQDLMRGEHVVGDKRRGAFAPPDGEYEYPVGQLQNASGTSIFDPVLCELAYRWFCPPAGIVLDPFAGGSVRGIVAAWLGRRYVGIDLRPEQVDANREQAGRIISENDPRWIVGDSREMDKHLREGEAFDFVFTCPPYFDLEIYSDDQADLSNASDYAEFIGAYRDIIAKSLARLNDDRFACIVVGDIRDKRGMYRNFVSDTIAAFQDAGAALYNEAILVTSAGSLPIRVGKQFDAARKLGKTHQNVLVFIKGDPKAATKAIGAVECGHIHEEVPNPNL